MLGVAPRSSRISLKVPVSSGLSANTRHTSPLVMTGRALPDFAVNDSTACPAVEAPGGGIAAGAFEIEGWVRVGWFSDGCVSGAGRFGPAAGPEGGARFMAGPVGGASGTEAGGTGGGRSENIWAETGPGVKTSKRASGSAARSPPASPFTATPIPPQTMTNPFPQKGGKFKPTCPDPGPLVEPHPPPNLN